MTANTSMQSIKNPPTTIACMKGVKLSLQVWVVPQPYVPLPSFFCPKQAPRWSNKDRTENSDICADICNVVAYTFQDTSGKAQGPARVSLLFSQKCNLATASWGNTLMKDHL